MFTLTRDTGMKIAAKQSLHNVSPVQRCVCFPAQVSFPAPLWRKSPSRAPGLETDSMCASMTSTQRRQETCNSREVRTHWQQIRESPNYNPRLFMACRHKILKSLISEAHMHADTHSRLCGCFAGMLTRESHQQTLTASTFLT